MEKILKSKEELQKLKTSELLDYMDLNIHTDYDNILDELVTRNFFSFLDEKIDEDRIRLKTLEVENQKLKDRVDKIDNLYNIANKLDMILNRLDNSKVKVIKKKV